MVPCIHLKKYGVYFIKVRFICQFDFKRQPENAIQAAFLQQYYKIIKTGF